MSRIIKEPVRYRDDGVLGPDAISKRLFGPTIIPGLYFAAALFLLSPHNAQIGAANTTMVRKNARKPFPPDDRDATTLNGRRTITRIVETAEYMTAFVYGDRATAEHAAEVVNRIHSRVEGTWDATGDVVHRASDPKNLLWLLVTFGQGGLDAYDAYGLGRVTRGDRDRMWRDEFTIIGEMNGIPRHLIPKSQGEIDDYIEGERPTLAMTAWSARFFDTVGLPRILSRRLPLPAAVIARLLALPGSAILPDWAMELAGRRPYAKLEKRAIIAAHRPTFAALGAPVLRDSVSLLASSPSRQVVVKSRLAQLTGRYDAPRQATQRGLATA